MERYYRWVSAMGGGEISISTMQRNLEHFTDRLAAGLPGGRNLAPPRLLLRWTAFEPPESGSPGGGKRRHQGESR